jgi:hypothetical protein
LYQIEETTMARFLEKVESSYQVSDWYEVHPSLDSLYIDRKIHITILRMQRM